MSLRGRDEKQTFLSSVRFFVLAVSHALAADSTITIRGYVRITAVVWPLNQPILLLI